MGYTLSPLNIGPQAGDIPRYGRQEHRPTRDTPEPKDGAERQLGPAAPFAVARVPIGLHTSRRLAPAAETLYKRTMGVRKKVLFRVRQGQPAHAQRSGVAQSLLELIRE